MSVIATAFRLFTKHSPVDQCHDGNIFHTLCDMAHSYGDYSLPLEQLRQRQTARTENECLLFYRLRNTFYFAYCIFHDLFNLNCSIMIEIDEHEQIVKIVWRHWFVLLGHIFMLIFAVFVPVVCVFMFNLIPVDNLVNISGSPSAAGGFFLVAWLIIVWMLGWNIWTNYFLNVLLITDIRIFDIQQNGFFSRKSASFRIDHIQNISVEQLGVIQTLLDFGTVHFETAGEDISLEADYIAHPYAIKKLVDEMQDGKLSESKEVHLHRDTLERIAPTSN